MDFTLPHHLPEKGLAELVACQALKLCWGGHLHIFNFLYTLIEIPPISPSSPANVWPAARAVKTTRGRHPSRRTRVTVCSAAAPPINPAARSEPSLRK